VTLREGSLVRATLGLRAFGGLGRLGVLVVDEVFAPAGTGTTGAFVDLRDTGVVCVRAPCFSYAMRVLNRAGREELSGVDLEAAGAGARQLERARATLDRRAAILVQGSVVETSDGGRALRASRIYLGPA
jgi:hypothetical protein